MRFENRLGRPGCCDFFQREYRRSERRDVEPLQHRIKHRTGRASIQFSTGTIACSAFSRFSIRSDLWEHCGCRPLLEWEWCIIRIHSMEKTIGPLVRDFNVTFLLATPTLLQIYMRSCTPEQFGGLRIVLTGAEKLPARLASAFEEQFGIHPLEGYGCTECSPCVAANTPDFRSAGYRQVGAKRAKSGSRCRESRCAL